MASHLRHGAIFILLVVILEALRSMKIYWPIIWVGAALLAFWIIVITACTRHMLQ
jgi:hypothetical protein